MPVQQRISCNPPPTQMAVEVDQTPRGLDLVSRPPRRQRHRPSVAFFATGRLKVDHEPRTGTSTSAAQSARLGYSTCSATCPRRPRSPEASKPTEPSVPPYPGTREAALALVAIALRKFEPVAILRASGSALAELPVQLVSGVGSTGLDRRSGRDILRVGHRCWPLGCASCTHEPDPKLTQARGSRRYSSRSELAAERTVFVLIG